MLMFNNEFYNTKYGFKIVKFIEADMTLCLGSFCIPWVNMWLVMKTSLYPY